MNLKFIKRGLVLTALLTTVLVPTSKVYAADATIAVPVLARETKFSKSLLLDTVAEVQADINIEETIKIETPEEIAFREMFRSKAFALLEEEQEYIFVREAEDEESAELGKVKEDTLLEVVERGEEYSVVSSGNLVGYVKNESLILGKDTSVKAKELLEVVFEDADVTALDEETIMGSFSIAETKEEEEARLAAEEAKRIEEEKAALRAKGQSVVSYAKQFLGNPYVYGGTSLTRGTDCSGFVMRVYQKFGISMPRTSYAMRSAGKAVSYNDMMPGDVVCYSGHVGIYAGNGQIVNAIDSAHGIGMTNVNYARIITIRRMF